MDLLVQIRRFALCLALGFIAVSCSHNSSKDASATTQGEVEEELDLQMSSEPSPAVSENKTKKVTDSRASPRLTSEQTSGAGEKSRPWKQWLEQGQIQKVVEECQLQLEERSGRDAWCWHVLAIQAYQEKRRRLARYYWQKAKEQGLPEEVYLNGVALLAVSEDDWAQAVELLKSASLKAGKSRKEAEMNLAVIYARFKQWDKARFILGRVRPEEIPSVSMANNLGAIALMSKDFDAAKKFFERGYQLKDSHKPLIVNYAILSIEHTKDMDLGRKLLDQWSFFGVQSGEDKVYQRLEKALASR